MKFQKPENPKVIWSSQMVKEKIDSVEGDIRDLNRQLNTNLSELNVIFEKRYTIRHNIGKKCIYKAQLLQQLKEAQQKESKDWSEL